ncbi:MAG: hypothetical protein JWQ09_3194 [Segetibacter sp.]|nr:hypothetical protein [Segetibacter sp.]
MLSLILPLCLVVKLTDSKYVILVKPIGVELLQKTAVENKKMYASFLQRLISRVLDFGILSCLLYLLSALYQPLWQDGKSLVFFSFYLLYYPIMEMMGGTAGKKIVGIKTVRLSGHLRISFRQSILRTLMQLAPLFLIFIFKLTGIYLLEYGILLLAAAMIFSYLLPLWTDKRQTLHDIVGKAVVVKLYAASTS